MLAFESAAGLGARDFMTIYGITAMDTELAGAGLQAFLGFFDQSFRDHDYDVGRAHAEVVAHDPELAKAGAIGPIVYAGSAIRPIDAQIGWAEIVGMPRIQGDLNQFKTGMEERVKQMVRELVGPCSCRWWLILWPGWQPAKY